MGYKPGVNSWEILRKHAVPLFQSGMSVVEMACGNMRRSVVRQEMVLLGVDYHFCDLNNRFESHPGFVRMRSEYEIGCGDDWFDAAVVFQALHNVRKPWRWLPEVARIVKHDGFIVIVDSITEGENRHPVDTGRLFRDGVVDLFDEAGLTMETYMTESLDQREISRRNQIGGAVPLNYVAIGRKP